tara:strand:+ start:3233 stop:3580 length:348 start_codon:yes stop_codon:yes gene_type:complete
MEILVAALILSMGIAGEERPKYPTISSLLRLQLPCLKYEIVESNLKYTGEQLRISAITAGGESLVEMWVDQENNDWTVVLHTIADDEGCIVATGKGVVEEVPNTTIKEKALNEKS